MKVKVLGAGQEVGRSGFLVNCDNANYLLDYGVNLGKNPQGPLHVMPKEVDTIVVTHAHLDHSGYVPLMYVSGNADVFATSPTFDLSRLLIEDMLKLERDAHPFGLPEVSKMFKFAKTLTYKQKVRRGNSSFELRESGHVVGGSTVLVESEGKKLFYTGDINVHGSRMIREADLDVGEIDLLITESTYSQTEQMPRKESEERFVEYANEILDQKGHLFVPAFSVERSQEIACILKNARFKHKIIMDGMALSVNEILLQHPDYLRDYDVFVDAIENTTWVRNHKERQREISEPCVIISPAGMLVGGNAVFYLQELAFDKKNGIALVSYQGEGTPGRKLLESGKVSIRGREQKAEAQIRQFEFSGHSDRNGLFELIKKIKGNPKVMAIHGDGESCTKFAQEIHEKFGFETYAPKIGDSITI
ncbi:MAG: MBL fold metallo-hydrolase [Candidatus Nitrosotenuis sp.]